MKRAIAYLRVSTTKQVDEGSSLENQADQIKKYCDLYKLNLLDTIIDFGQSGRKDNREGFVKVIDMIRKKEIDCVVVYSISRFTRGTKKLIEVVDLMKKHDVALKSIKENIDTSSAMGTFFYTLMGALNELESNQLGERIRDVKRYNKGEKRTYCSPVFGYSNDTANKKMVPIEGELKVVKLIYGMNHSGASLGEISRRLNGDGVPTKNNAIWHPSTVQKILKNPIYITH